MMSENVEKQSLPLHLIQVTEDGNVSEFFGGMYCTIRYLIYRPEKPSSFKWTYSSRTCLKVSSIFSHEIVRKRTWSNRTIVKVRSMQIRN